MFEGAAYIGIEGGAQTMSLDLASLPLHRGAEAYYRKAGFLAPTQSLAKRVVTWLQSTWYIATILVVLVGVYRGSLKYRRDRMSNEIGRRILGVSIETDEPDSVHKHSQIREEIRERVQRRWWHVGELDKPRWRYLDDLIRDRIASAQENTTKQLAEEIRSAMTVAANDEITRDTGLRTLEERVWECFRRTELNASQMSMLREMIREGNQVS